MIDIQEKKDKIISYIETNGPSLPVRIAKAIEMDPVFASAILSELLSSKQIKMSHLKIGASSLYLLQGQEQKLEEYTENLKSIENEAYIKLKKERVLDDEKENPAIRVALRNIKDFAIPFKFQNKIMWKYAFTTDEEIENILNPKKEKPKTEEKLEFSKKKIENIFHQSETKKDISTIHQEEKPNSTKTFLKEIEEFLEKQNTKIVSIEEVDKRKVVAKIETNSKFSILFAFNKKRINEQELMKCYKQAKSKNLPYQIIILGELTKKINDTIDAYKKLQRIDKLE